MVTSQTIHISLGILIGVVWENPTDKSGISYGFLWMCVLLISMLSDQFLYPNLQVFEHLGLVLFFAPLIGLILGSVNEEDGYNFGNLSV